MLPQSSPSQVHSPLFDVADPVEIVRTTEESWLFTRTMGGPLADIPAPSSLDNVLDLACGPGDWALDTAFLNPSMNVAGIDLNPTIIEYANARARSQQQYNVSFGVMDWLSRLDFSKSTFDLINGRVLSFIIPRTQWLPVLQECQRVLHRGGILRLIDFDLIQASSPALEKLHTIFLRALHRAGYGLSPTGHTLGLSPTLPHLFRSAGFTNITYTTYTINFSANTENWNTLYRDIEIASNALIPMAIATGTASQAEIDDLYQQQFIEMLADDFGGIWTFFSICGIKQ